MTVPTLALPPLPPPTFAELFTPKLVTCLREGYGMGRLKADAIAGLTVAIVALPLSMAIAIASGASPAQGLYTAIVGGFVVSLFSGSRFQIGGPAGAFIVLVAATIAQHGMDGLIIATLLSGVLLMAMGLLQLGTYIKFIPYPVTVGFTAGIAVIIFASQIKDLFGLTLSGPEPGPLLEKLPVLWQAWPSADPVSIALALGSVAVIAVLRRARPHWPGMLIAVAGGAVLTALLGLDVATIGSRFGGIPQSLPMPALPDLSAAKVMEMLPAAFSFALLGSIESLLSATVADGMTGRRHRSNCELVGQGAANIAAALFGGFCRHRHHRAHRHQRARRGDQPGFGDAARAVSARVHAGGGAAGVVHSARLACRGAGRGGVDDGREAGVRPPAHGLARRCGGAARHVLPHHFPRSDRGDRRRFRTRFGAVHPPHVADDRDRGSRAVRRRGCARRLPRASAVRRGVVAWRRRLRITGAFFFGAASSIGSVLDRIADTSRTLVIDLSAVPFVDSTAANTIEGLAHKAARRGMALILAGASEAIRTELAAHACARRWFRSRTTWTLPLPRWGRWNLQERPEPLPLLYPIGYNALL